MSAIFIFQVLISCFLCGLIWCIQVVHYPLFHRVGKPDFQAYHHAHTYRISWIVIVPMVLELSLSLFSIWQLPAPLTPFQAWLGFALVLIIWLSTFLLQVPLHNQLQNASDRLIRRLVLSNWIRTTAWSLRAIFFSWIMLLYKA